MEVHSDGLDQCKCISRGKSDMYLVASRIAKVQEQFVKFLSICSA